MNDDAPERILEVRYVGEVFVGWDDPPTLYIRMDDHWFALPETALRQILQNELPPDVLVRWRASDKLGEIPTSGA